MVSTRVGYAGGTRSNPTYRSIGDHTETVEIDYDPRVTSYRELLAVFWKSHNPCATPWSRQYISAIFVHDGEQRRLAEATRVPGARTEILPYTGFTLAEDYHQEHRLRRLKTVERELEAYYPELEDLVRSTAATRINALAGGHGGAAELDTLADDLGLSPQALAELRRAVH